MKHFFTYVWVAIALTSSLTACDTDATEPLPNESLPEFYVHAQLNGKNWTKRGNGFYATKMQRFTVSGGTSSATEKYDITNLSFHLAKDELGAIGKSLPTRVQAFPALWLQVENEDIITDSFRSDSLNVPTIEITRLDTVEKIMEGRFQATLRRDSHLTNKVELMDFREGSFRVRYQERAL